MTDMLTSLLLVLLALGQPAPQDAPGAAADLDGLPIYGTLLDLAPGQTAWLDRGTRHGVVAGETWWLRVRGQPVGRLDLVFAGPRHSFGRLTPLADGLGFVRGMRFQRWFVPGQRQPLASAVAYPDAGEPAVWIALPPRVAAGGQRIVFDGGRGILERRQGGFGFVRLSPATSPDDVAAGLHVEIVPADESRLTCRTFRAAGGGATYVDAGRVDHLDAGDQGTLRSDAGPRSVRAVRVSGNYATIAADDGRPIEAGASVDFAPPRPVAEGGVVVAVFGPDGFRCAGVRPGRVALIEDGQVVAVGRIEGDGDGEVAGRIWRDYSLRSPREGDQVVPIGGSGSER